jgi:hypothetical protein
MFSYADDICIVAQDEKFENIEETLTSNLLRLEYFFQKWRLRSNPHKTIISTFHLNNREANKEISVHFCGERIKNEKTPVYLGIILYRTLSFKKQLHKLSAKLKTRIGFINKLASTTWEATTNVLQTSSLTLAYSVEVYCAPVWKISAHTEVVDI